LEALYKKIHAEIRKTPIRPKPAEKKTVRKTISKAGDKSVVFENSKGKKWLRHLKLNKEERRERINKKILDAVTK